MNHRLAKTDFNKQELEFVGREQCIESILKKANSLNQSSEILFVKGPYGIGKSKLLSEIHHQVNYVEQNFNTISAFLYLTEFEYSQQELSLEYFRTRLVQDKSLKISFNLFDYAYFIYLSKTDSDYTITNFSNRLLNTSGIICDLMALLHAFPSEEIGLKLLQKADNHLTYINQLLHSFSADLKELENLHSWEILDKLPIYFAKDLQHYLDENSVKAVLLWDCYDYMIDQKISLNGISNQWEWLLDKKKGIFHLLKNVLFIIVLRDDMLKFKYKIRLSESLETIILNTLSIEDTKRSLSVIPEEEIRNSIFRISEGHPYTFNLAYETYLALEDKSSAEKIAIFEKLNSSEMLHDYFIENITERERILLKVLSCSRFWNEECFNYLNQHFNLGFNDLDFTSFVNHTYVEQINDSEFALSTLIKEKLHKTIDASFKIKTHQALFDYYNLSLAFNHDDRLG